MNDLQNYFWHIHPPTLEQWQCHQQPLEYPESIQPREHMLIIDVPKFVTTHLQRLESESPLLRRIAEGNLKALKNILNQ